MSNDCKTIIETFQEVRRFHSNVALLLKTSDELFGRQGWKYTPGVGCWWTGTASLEKPYRWLPTSFFRAYTNHDNPRTLAFLSVIIERLADLEQTQGTVLLTGGGLIHSAPTGWSKALPSQETEIFRWHLFRRDRDESRRISWQTLPLWPTGAPKELRGAASNVTEAVTFACPLFEVKAADDLETIVNELLIEIQNHKPQAPSSEDFAVLQSSKTAEPFS